MSTLGQLTVELELDDNKFTTRVSSAGAALRGLQTTLNQTVSVTNSYNNSVGGSGAHIASWVTAIGHADSALQNIRSVMTGWIEKITHVNSELEQTVVLHAGLSKGIDDVHKLKEAWENYHQILSLTANTPFSLDQLTKSFVQLKTAGIEPTVKAMGALTDAVAAFGGDDQRLQRASYAIQEMAGRGVVSLTQLQRQLGQDIPSAVQMMARAMNLTLGQLHEAVTKGTLQSAHAVALLLDEMERSFGGSAAKQMNTFKGAVALFTTEIMKLQQLAGGVSESSGREFSSFYAITDALTHITDLLRSNEAKSMAIALNDALREITQVGVKVIDFFVKWGDSILTIGGYLATYIVATRTAAIAMAGLAAVTGLFGTATAGGGFVASAAAASLASNIGSIGRAIGTAGAGLAAQFMILNGSMLAAGSTMTGIAGAAVSLAGVIGALTTTFAILAIPVAILFGFDQIIRKMIEMRKVANETGDAVGRVLQGDVTAKTEQSARSEIPYIEKKIEALRSMIAMMQRLKDKAATPAEAFNASRDLSGFANGADIDLKALGVDGNTFTTGKGLSKVIDATTATLSDWQTRLNTAHEMIGSIASRRMIADAERSTEMLMRSVSGNILQYSTIHRATMEKVLAEREALAEVQKDGPEGQALNVRSMESVKKYYSDVQAYLAQRVADVRTKLAAATEESDKVTYGMQLERLQTFLDEYTAAAAEKIDRFGKVLTIADVHMLEKQKKSAENMIISFKDRSAGLISDIEGQGSALGKVNQMLADHDKLTLVASLADQTLARELREAAHAMDEANTKHKAWTDSVKLAATIDNAFTKAGSDVQAFLAKLTDPSMPEAQRSFAELQGRMTQELELYTAAVMAAKGGTEGLSLAIDMANKVAETTRFASLGNVLSQIAVAESKAEDARLRNLSPAARLTAIKDNVGRKYDGLRGQLKNVQDGDLSIFSAKLGLPEYLNRDQLLKKLDTAQSAEADAEGRRYDSSTHKLGMPAANEIERLTGRVAQLRAEIAGGHGEFEKFSAIFQTNDGKYSGRQEEILALAKQVDEYTEKLKLANRAQQALTTLDNNAAASRERTELASEIMGRGKLLEIERQVLDFRVRQSRDVKRVTDFYGEGSPQAKRAQGFADAGAASEGQALVREQSDSLKTQAMELKKSFGETLTLRRETGMREIELEREKIASLIALYETDTAKRMIEEQNLADYIAAKREALHRQTENGLEKLARQWADTDANIGKFGSDAMGKLEDAIDQLVTKGKFNFTDLSNWAIKELLKISAKTLLSPLMTALGGAGGGIGGWISGLISTPAAGAPTEFAQSGVPGRLQHSGGINGFDSLPSRIVSAGTFTGAPRFHTGIGPGEYPAILQYGEGVFTAGQMEAIGELNHNYGRMDQALSAIAMSIVAIPRAIAGASYANNNGSYGAYPSQAAGSGSMGNVTINMTNQSNQPLQADAGQPKFDGEKFVMDIVIRNVQQPGAFRNALRSFQ